MLSAALFVACSADGPDDNGNNNSSSSSSSTSSSGTASGTDTSTDTGTGTGADCPNGDKDSDTICDDVDVCPDDADTDQKDFNSDGVGDACDTIYIPLADLSTSAKYYEYQAMKSVVVKYFAVLDNNNKPHVAFDACDLCYPKKKGYDQVGDEMKCNNCGKVFKIEGIGTENIGGGCWPGHIPIVVGDTDIAIEPEDLEAGSYYFE